jgi:exopolysaccharide biosynthesis polyprenyl glycosylphosphotransferase
MFRTSKPILGQIYALMSASVTLFVLLGVFIVVNRHEMPVGLGEFLAIRITVKNLMVTALFLSSLVFSFTAFGLTRPSPTDPFWDELVRVTKVCGLAATFALLYPLTSSSGAFSGAVIVYFFPSAIVACLCGRYTARSFAGRFATFLHGTRDTIIVGSGPRATALYERSMNSGNGYIRVLGFVDSPNGHVLSAAVRRQMLGSLDEFEEILMRRSVDEVLIALPAKSCYSQIQTAIQVCERAGVEAKYLADIFELSLAKPEYEPHVGASVVSLKVVQDDYRLVVKRCIDLVGSIVGLILFSPVMLAIAAAIKMTNPGPVFFVQERYGLNKRTFPMYKFRTMVLEAEKLQDAIESLNELKGPVFKIQKDPRITAIGRFLRVSSLDELPQLANVLRGEMSLVGPRPLPRRDVSLFDDSSLMRRFSVKPGLTGLWQINGRTDTTFKRWIELDLLYIDTWSLRLDLQILAMTIPAVLKGQGAA